MGKIVRSNLTDQIYEYIRDQITSGVWKPNEKIPSENDLAKELGVSRMSLRMGINKATVMGLTETRAGEGTYVTAFNMRNFFRDLYDSELIPKNYQQINDFRMVIQIGSVRLALLRDEDLSEEVAELSVIYQEMVDAVGREDDDTFHDADFRFHECVCRMSHNPLIILLYDAVASTMFEVSKSNTDHSREHFKSMCQVLEFHEAILDGIRERNLDKCIQAELRSVMRSHNYYKDHPNPFPDEEQEK